MRFNLLNKTSMAMGRTGMKIRKVSPEILIGVGIASVVGGGILACKATLKVDDILDETKDDLDKIHRVKEVVDSGEALPNGDTYTDNDYRKDLTVVYSRTAGKMLKIYWPALTLGAVGILSILSGYNILNTRYVAAAAAYTAVDSAYSEYRKRVVGELGEEMDRHFRYGTEKAGEIEVTTIDENGEVKTHKEKDKEVISGLGYSEYARFFDSASEHWQKSPEYNLLFLKQQQQYANDLLQTRGHIFLNEVYDMLGLPRTSAGAVVGWVKGYGDDYVDFGMYDYTREVVRDFVNGYESVILLDFNVDGIIWDKI